MHGVCKNDELKSLPSFVLELVKKVKEQQQEKHEQFLLAVAALEKQILEYSFSKWMDVYGK